MSSPRHSGRIINTSVVVNDAFCAVILERLSFMCDTIAIVSPGRMFFAKNSDRDPNEAQSLEWYSRQHYVTGAEVECTWIRIPQAAHTRAVLLSRPFWMWGAEMGANEDGVIIGNEAVFTRQPYAHSGLTGMDLVRLGLERARTARQACDVIIELLEKWGQGGGCGHENRRFTYHNSFLAVDHEEGYVLETAGRAWAIEKVKGVRAISNGLTIPDFADKHKDLVKTHISRCAVRRRRAETLAQECHNALDMFRLLRDHGADRSYPVYSPVNGGMAALCMHGGGMVAASQTTASWAAELTPEGWRHWVTATAAPCTSLFKPVHVHEPLELGAFPTDHYDDSLWWRHEMFHRTVMADPQACFPVFEAERETLEAAWTRDAPTAQHAFAAHDEALLRWRARLPRTTDARPAFVRRYWARRNKKAGLL